MSVDENFPQLLWFQVMTSLNCRESSGFINTKAEPQVGFLVLTWVMGVAECDAINSPWRMAKIMA